MHRIASLALLAATATVSTAGDRLRFEFTPAAQDGITVRVDGIVDTSHEGRIDFNGSVEIRTAAPAPAPARAAQPEPPALGSFELAVHTDRVDATVLTFPAGIFILGDAPEHSSALLHTTTEDGRAAFTLFELGENETLATVIVEDGRAPLSDHELRAMLALMNPSALEPSACDPSFPKLLSTGASVCGEKGFETLFYGCDQRTGSVRVRFECRRGDMAARD